MLTVKKFLTLFDLSIGGYASGVFGLLWALLTIFEFPPDIDLQEESDESENETSSVSSVTGATVDEEGEEVIPEHEVKDEINDVLLGVNITLIFIGWVLVIASLLLIYGTFKRQSRLLIPFMFALLQTVSLVILLEFLPEFIDQLEVQWFLIINFIVAIATYIMMVVYSLYLEFYEEELNKLNIHSTGAFYPH